MHWPPNRWKLLSACCQIQVEPRTMKPRFRPRWPNRTAWTLTHPCRISAAKSTLGCVSPSPSKTRGTWTPLSVAWSWTKRRVNGPRASLTTRIKPSLRSKFPHEEASMSPSWSRSKVLRNAIRRTSGCASSTLTTTAPKTTTAMAFLTIKRRSASLPSASTRSTAWTSGLPMPSPATPNASNCLPAAR